MGIVGWILYVFIGIIIFGIISFIQNKYGVTKLEKLIITLIIFLIIAGLLFEWGIPYTSDFFLVLVFTLITDAVYSGYFLGKDFFDQSEGNLLYYVILIICGFLINQEFINEVSKVFLTGEDLRIVLWFLSFIFIYHFCVEKKIFQKIITNHEITIRPESILVQYTKLKYQYHDYCSYDNKDITSIIYAIMIYENNKRSKFLRNIDYFKFRFNGEKRKLGIMQVGSNKYISDIESIEIVHKKIEKLYEKNKPSRGKVKIEDVIKSYDKNNYQEILLIFDIINKF